MRNDSELDEQLEKLISGSLKSFFDAHLEVDRKYYSSIRKRLSIKNIKAIITTEKRRLLERVEKEVIKKNEVVPHEKEGVFLCTCHKGTYPEERVKTKNDWKDEQRQSLDQLRKEEGV